MFSPYNILGGLIFGTIGWGAWRYGKQLSLWKPIAIGLVLMVYPIFCTAAWETWLVGTGLCVLLWFHHDE
jgi:ACR3 family arsenite efflux pump ArsB